MQKDVLLTQVTDSIGKQAGLKIKVDPVFSNAKVTVFVKEMPAKDLLDRLARLYDLDGNAKENTYSLTFSAKHQKAYGSYLDAEQTLRITKVHAKLEALAKLTLRDPNAKPDKEVPDTAMKWALAHIARPEYRVLGLWERGTNLKHPGTPLAEWYRYLMSGAGCNFWVGELPEPVPLSILHGPGPAEAFIDERSVDLRGAVVQIAAYRTTGEIVVKPIRNIQVTPDDPAERESGDPKPPKELQKTDFAQDLEEWQVPIPDKAITTKNVDAEPPPDPGYHNQKFSLTEKLEYLHRLSGVPIIATSFRTPAMSQAYPDASRAQDVVDDLRVKEKAILRWDDGCLMVRHPAYWLLECTEPVEAVIRKCEDDAKQRPLSLGAYISMAFLFAQHADAVPRWQNPLESERRPSTTLPRCFERLIDDRAFLSRFDPGPLEKDFPILMVLGSMHNDDLDAMAQGAKIDSWSLNYPVTFTRLFKSGPPLGITDTHKKLPSGQEILMEHRRWYADGWAGSVGAGVVEKTSYLADLAADCAPLFSAKTSENYFLTRWECRGGVHDHIPRTYMVASQETDPESQIWADSTDQRARFIWIESMSDTFYRIGVGFSDNAVATYDIEIGQSH